MASVVCDGSTSRVLEYLDLLFIKGQNPESSGRCLYVAGLVNAYIDQHPEKLSRGISTNLINACYRPDPSGRATQEVCSVLKNWVLIESNEGRVDLPWLSAKISPEMLQSVSEMPAVPNSIHKPPLRIYNEGEALQAVLDLFERSRYTSDGSQKLYNFLLGFMTRGDYEEGPEDVINAELDKMLVIVDHLNNGQNFDALYKMSSLLKNERNARLFIRFLNEKVQTNQVF